MQAGLKLFCHRAVIELVTFSPWFWDHRCEHDPWVLLCWGSNPGLLIHSASTLKVSYIPRQDDQPIKNCSWVWTALAKGSCTKLSGVFCTPPLWEWVATLLSASSQGVLNKNDNSGRGETSRNVSEKQHLLACFQEPIFAKHGKSIAPYLHAYVCRTEMCVRGEKPSDSSKHLVEEKGETKWLLKFSVLKNNFLFKAF